MMPECHLLRSHAIVVGLNGGKAQNIEWLSGQAKIFDIGQHHNYLKIQCL